MKKNKKIKKGKLAEIKRNGKVKLTKEAKNKDLRIEYDDTLFEVIEKNKP